MRLRPMNSAFAEGSLPLLYPSIAGSATGKSPDKQVRRSVRKLSSAGRKFLS
jgi:hypothetical protein